ncbi:MAG TPA: HD domain-containing phosphohydrolase [Bordetella sp.]|uniref:HD domain-containing phosphohydrolase n=1 Tax=Bordetella sp. TaxID=28081 RepID=UPI002ED28C67
MNILERAVCAWWRHRLATHLAVVFGATILAAMLVMIAYVNSKTVDIVQDASQTLFDHAVGQSRSEIDKSISRIDPMLQMLAADPQAADFLGASQAVFIRRMSLALNVSPFTSTIYIGFDDGGFVLLRKLSTAAARQKVDAPDSAHYILEVDPPPSAGGARQVSFLDAGLATVEVRADPTRPYDPRTRPWYQAAIASQGAILTDPYGFFLSQDRGLTIARRLQSGHGVAGADFTLADLSQALSQMASTPSSILLIANDHGQVLASSEPMAPRETNAAAAASAAAPPAPTSIMANMAAAAANMPAGPAQSHVVQVRGREWIMRSAPLHSGNWTFRIVAATPSDEVLASERKLVSTISWLGVALVTFVGLIIMVAARTVSRPLLRLADEAECIARFEFHPVPAMHSSVQEVQMLSRAIGKAGQTIQRFTEIGQALITEREPARLIGRLLQETLAIMEAEGGLILLSEADGQALSVAARNVPAQGAPASDSEPRSLDSADVDDQIRQILASKNVVCFDRDSSSLSPLLADLTGPAPLAHGQIFRFVVIPLLNSAEEVIGGLLLAVRADARASMSDASLAVARALSGTAAIAIETRQLLKARKSLLDATIRMIANAIDAKSPYTSGHCQRVPMLTMALTQAAQAARTEPFADFALSPEEWEAVEVAGWLHDCGKLTTAEYVVDKATKLETIYDRLHEIRMRFELLKACCHADYWRGMAQGGDAQALAAIRDAELTALDADFAFVAACNEGGEAMADVDIARLRNIGERTWVRTLDDRIGISRDEKLRKDRVPATVLPVQEPLLSDRAEHLIEHRDNRLGEMESQGGFSMKPPRHRLNLGEIYNLSIGRGTLTAEERYEINRHMTRTIVMLQDLPLTGALRQVPEFAGGHHERMDGTGFPRGLRREDMSVVARSMAIADVFEALTAADRPYKKAKKLSEAIRIMGAMKNDRHLDPDLLDLFLKEGIWRRYAQQYLSPEQIDEPDIDAVLAIRPA